MKYDEIIVKLNINDLKTLFNNFDIGGEGQVVCCRVFILEFKFSCVLGEINLCMIV